jgi:signal transduction histidine kinase
VGLSGQLAAQAGSRPYLNNDVGGDPDSTQADPAQSVRAVAGVPLVAQQQLIGVLCAGRQTEISAHELSLLGTIGDVVANALQRAQIVETLEQRVAERTGELAEANAQLTELDRLKSKFVSDVSHELRTPVSNLKLYADLLERGKPDKRAQYLDILKQQADRLAQLVEDILSLSRLELGEGKPQFAEVDLNALIDAIMAAHQPSADAIGLQLSFEPDKDLPPVRGERNQLAQVITNLVANAIHYTLAGEVRVSSHFAGRQACIQVSDTGIGIDPEDLPHIFERFYRGQHTSQSDIPGSGLGLAIVKEIVVLHGGNIEVESRAGEGSTFSVYLPIAGATTPDLAQ